MKRAKEIGANRIARVDVDFLSAPKPFGMFHGASEAMRIDKEHFGASRRARWFGGLRLLSCRPTGLLLGLCPARRPSRQVARAPFALATFAVWLQFSVASRRGW